MSFAKAARAWLARAWEPFSGRVQKRRFEAARIDRTTGNWFATESSINEELRADLNALRARGRQLVQNNDYAKKFKGMVEDNIIGHAGLRLQVRVEDKPGAPDDLANSAIESAWLEWAQGCDITGRQTLRDMCTTLVGGLPSDGEFLVRLVRGADAGNRFNFALQIIDVDRIDTLFNGSYEGRAVIMGVEVDDYRRPVALHLYAAHPNDGSRSSRQRVRVLIADLIHGFKVERAEQVRGIPWMAPGMLSLHHLGGFMRSALLAAEHGANHYGFFMQSLDAVGGPPLGSPNSEEQVNITTTQPGTYDTLPAGYSYQQHDSKYPNEVFGPFVKTCLQRIATGWRVAYHSLANDLEGVSFSSIRSGTLEERDRWMADQEWFISTLAERVHAQWLQMALMSQAIVMPNGSPLPYAKIKKFSGHVWQARRWDWVDPKADMAAKVIAVQAGLLAPQDLCAAMGGDFEDVIKAIASANKLATKHGVLLPAYDPKPGVIPAQNTPST
jgi:lambda family phage portal protein